MSTIGVQHLKPLAIFSSVVDEGSFAGAARTLRTSRSRVSEQITQLEEDLGVRLLQRSTRKLSLTEEGRRIYEKARTLSRVLEETHEIASQEKPSGRVSITTPHDIGVSQLLPALASFRNRYPDVVLDIILNDNRLDLIQEGIDMALRVGLPKDDSLIGRVLYEESFSLFASPDYLAANGTPTTVQELAKHRWICLTHVSPRGVHQLYRDDELTTLQSSQFEVCNSPLMMIRMALANMGIAQIFPSTIRQELARGQLVPVMPELKGPSMLFSLVYPSRKQMPLRTRALIDHLMSADMFEDRP
ncbi:LysR family transcriptional regulator [Cohaesibacter celericrescens]|uniref:LysR family transcriptional regulator n=1 Tax=Cohaesibacter celericrescens TaxID=2067669 RepID=A0A2N5XV61_9HYPH|nr:LysR family transcriptional regulator [Cohaesibacter celericrescens]PLW78347.1 LysR family transcriptional regulator [Cohaesibacter celericrescens]